MDKECTYKTRALYFRCNKCDQVDVVLGKDAREWRCPNCFINNQNFNKEQEMRYEIDVRLDRVIVWGFLTVSDLKTIIEMFEKKGYTEVCMGSENSTLYLKKTAIKVEK